MAPPSAQAEELHFHHAAGRLFLSQQALSKRIVRLETLLGVRLLQRSSRGVTLTSAGERLLPEARQAVDVLDAALAAVNTGPQTLTVDVLDEHLAMLPSVRQINQREPKLSVTVVMRADAQPALSMLRTGTADIALGRPGALDPAGPRWPADIRGQEVLAEPIRLLVPVGHHLDRPEGVRLEQLVGQPLWFPTTGAPAEWTQLLTEFVDVFDLSLDQTGSTFGYRYWLERIADGSAPISFIGAAMNIPAELPASVVPLFDPTPVFLWWAMWRRRIRPDLAGRFLSALENELKNERFPSTIVGCLNGIGLSNAARNAARNTVTRRVPGPGVGESRPAGSQGDDINARAGRRSGSWGSADVRTRSRLSESTTVDA